MIVSAEQWLVLIAIVGIPLLAGHVITGAVTAWENKKMLRRHAEFEQFLSSMPDDDDDLDEHAAITENPVRSAGSGRA